MDLPIPLTKMLLASALFHAAVLVVLLGVVLDRSVPRFIPPAYQVDLVTLPSPPAPVAEVREAPAAPPAPPVQKPQAKIKEPERPKKIEAKKPPLQPPPKPIRPAAAVPPPAKSKEAAPPKEAVSEKPSPSAKPSEAVAAIPSAGARVEAGIEAPDFKYPYYLDLIQRKIEMHWSPPPMDSATEIKETVVGFVLSANGRIGNPRIERSSGNAFFDQAALRAIYQASPLPPFPQGIRDPSLKVHFSFSLTKKS